jgi:hypothetical protein
MNLRGRLRRMSTHRSDKSSSETRVDSDVARYKYLLRVSSPQVFDLVHAEVFAQFPDAVREAVYRRLCRDLSEELRPTSADPVELARAAACAQDDDPVYLLRVLRRPGGGTCNRAGARGYASGGFHNVWRVRARVRGANGGRVACRCRDTPRVRDVDGGGADPPHPLGPSAGRRGPASAACGLAAVAPAGAGPGHAGRTPVRGCGTLGRQRRTTTVRRSEAGLS